MQRLVTLLLCTLVVGGAGYVRWASLDFTSSDPWGVGVVFGTVTLAVIAGELSRVLKLPRLHGYAAIGLLAVTYNATILRPAGLSSTVDPADFFDQWSALYVLALAVAGLSAGLRVDLSLLRAHLRTVAANTAGQILGVVPIIALVLWWAESRTAMFGTASLLVVALGALLIGTSSLTAMYAVNSDMRAEGRLPDMQMLIGAVKNTLLLGAAFLAVVLATSHSVADSLSSTGLAIVASVGGGLAVGCALLLVLRYASVQVMLVVYSAAIAAALTWSHAPVATFAAALLAGIVTGSSSNFAYQVSESLDRANPFVLAVVFSFLLADVVLPLTVQAWSLALLLMAVRGIGMFAGSRAAVSTSTEMVGRHLPYAMLSQSLVALFALDVIAEFAPALDVLEPIVVPVVVLNIFFGTLLHRLALVRSGLASEVAPREGDGVVVHDLPKISGPRTTLDDDRSLLPAPEYPDPAFRSDKLNRLVQRIRQRMLRAQDTLAHQFFAPRRQFVEHIVEEVRDRLQDHVFTTFQQLRDVGDLEARKLLARERRASLEADLQELILVYGPTHEPGSLDETLKSFLLDLERACHVDAQVRAPEEDATRQLSPGDSRYVRLRKRLHVLDTRFGPRPMRVVPVRALALHHLAHGTPHELAASINIDGRFRVYVWQRISNAYGRVTDVYARMLEHLDEQSDDAYNIVAAPFDEDAVARESEELAEFEERLRQLARTTDGLSEQSGGTVQPLLPADDDDGEPDVVLAAWSTLLDELPVDFEDLERDIFDFEADVRRRVALTTDQMYRNLLDDLARAGTFALPARQIDSTTRRSAAQRDIDMLTGALEHWSLLAHAFVDRRLMQLGYRELEAQLRALLRTFTDTVDTELSSHLTYYPAEISERCDDVVRSLQETFAANVSDADLTDAFVQIRRNLSDFIQEDALQSVQELRETGLFTELIRKFTDRMEDLVREQRSLHLIADESYLDRPETASAEDIEIAEVPFQELLEKHLLRSTTTSFNEVAMRVRNIVDTVATGLGEVNRVISFNLDAAAGEIRTDSSEEATNRDLAAEFAIGGIRRAGDHATTLLEQVKTEVDGIDDEVLERTLEHVRTTRRYIFDDSMGRLERLALDVDRDRSKFQQRGVELLREARDMTLTTLETVSRPARVAADLARERLSLEEFGREELIADAAHASFGSTALEALPLAYRRLFTPNPVELPGLYITRDAVDERISAAVERWNEGRRVSIVVSGDLGTGKTSFLHRTLANHLSNARMVRWNIRERITQERQLLAELNRLFGFRASNLTRAAAALRDLDSPRVVVVDGIERLFLRTVRGTLAMREFLSFVSQSPPDVLWLMTCNSTLWQYLTTMHNASDFVTDEVEMDHLDVDATEALVMRRHDVSGYSVEFGIDEAERIMPTRFVAGQQPRLRRRYFKRLHDATGGHPLLSLYYWLSSLERHDEDQLIVHPLQPLRTDHLRKLQDDKLIGLGQLVLHEELSETSFAQVMRMSEEDARRDLAFLESLNLVWREPGRELQFRVNVVLYHDIERALLEHNIV